MAQRIADSKHWDWLEGIQEYSVFDHSSYKRQQVPNNVDDFLDVCNPSPCYNGGTCKIESGIAKCDCPNGCFGRFCQESK